MLQSDIHVRNNAILFLEKNKLDHGEGGEFNKESHDQSTKAITIQIDTRLKACMQTIL